MFFFHGGGCVGGTSLIQQWMTAERTLHLAPEGLVGVEETNLHTPFWVVAFEALATRFVTESSTAENNLASDNVLECCLGVSALAFLADDDGTEIIRVLIVNDERKHHRVRKDKIHLVVTMLVRFPVSKRGNDICLRKTYSSNWRTENELVIANPPGFNVSSLWVVNGNGHCFNECKGGGVNIKMGIRDNFNFAPRLDLETLIS